MTISRVWTDPELTRGILVNSANMDTLDANSVRNVNGDEGASYTLSAPLTISGEGVVAAGRWILSQSVHATTAADKPILFNRGAKDDYFGFVEGHPGEHPQVGVLFNEICCPDPFVQASDWRAGTLYKPPLWQPKLNAEVREPRRFSVQLNVYNGAPSMGVVVLRFLIGAHSNPPQSFTKVRVIAVDEQGNITPLREADLLTDEDGFMSPGMYRHPLTGVAVPKTAAEWRYAGNIQAWPYECNVDHVVDISKYTYFIEIIDETGTNSVTPNSYWSAQVCHSTVNIFDGRN